MSVDSSANKVPGAVDVHVRTVMSGDGSETAKLLVRCPRREETISMKQCVDCVHCSSFSLDLRSEQWLLVCDWMAAQQGKRPVFQPTDASSAKHADLHTPVSAIMSRKVLCVRPDLSIDALLNLLLEHGISGAPVVDDIGRPIGVVSKTDLLGETFTRSGSENDVSIQVRFDNDEECEAGFGLRVNQTAPRTVGQIMTPITFCLHENASIPRAAALMTYEGIHRLLVISEQGEIIGLVSSMDVMRWLGESAGFVIGNRSTQARRMENEQPV